MFTCKSRLSSFKGTQAAICDGRWFGWPIFWTLIKSWAWKLFSREIFCSQTSKTQEEEFSRKIQPKRPFDFHLINLNDNRSCFTALRRMYEFFECPRPSFGLLITSLTSSLMKRGRFPRAPSGVSWFNSPCGRPRDLWNQMWSSWRYRNSWLKAAGIRRDSLTRFPTNLMS